MSKPHLRIAFNSAKDELTIDVEGVIGESFDWWTGQKGTTKEQVAEKLKEIANSRASSILVNINSYGGDVNHGISIHDMLAEHKAKVTTVVHGHTASAATIISQAGDTRRMSSNALFLVHRASAMAIGNVNDLDLISSDLKKCDETIAGIYAKRTGKSQAEMTAIMDRYNGQGEWLTANEAKDLGFIDEVYEPMKAVAMVEPGTFTAMGLPEIPKDKLKNTDMNADKKTVFAWFKEFVKTNFGKDIEEPTPAPAVDPPADPAPAPDPVPDPAPNPTPDPAPAPEPSAIVNEVVLKDIKEVQDTLTDLTTQNEAKAIEITDLKAKLQAAQDEITKLKAGPTMTFPRDDPFTDQSNLKSNEVSSEANAANLRGDK